MSPVQFSYSTSSLPASFLSSSQWPGLVSGPEKEAADCGSWSVSAVSVLEDRTSISRGHKVRLDSHSLGCQQDSVSRAWNYLRQHLRS